MGYGKMGAMKDKVTKPISAKEKEVVISEALKAKCEKFKLLK